MLTLGRKFLIGSSLSLSVLSGCAGDYHLVSRGLAPRITGWHRYATPREPENQLEQAVLQVAHSRKKVSLAGFDVAYIDTRLQNSRRVHCIDLVSPSHSDDPYAERSVTRYQVVGGKIAAMSDATDEFFVDEELERAIDNAAAKAWSPDPVILYEDGVHTISIAGRPINRCTVKVTLFDGDAVGTPIASKRVTTCSLY